MRKLFKELCGARVERVEFDEEMQSQKRGLVLGREMVVQGTVVSVPVEVKGKKRKRGADAEGEVIRKTMEEMALPGTWDRKVLRSGGCGVVVFVDEVTREGALRECARVKRKGRVVGWPVVEGEELGLQRGFLPRGNHVGEYVSILIVDRISDTSFPHVPVPLGSPTQCQHISNAFHGSRNRALHTPRSSTTGTRRRWLRHSHKGR